MQTLHRRAARFLTAATVAALLGTVLGPPAQATPANNYPISGFFIAASTNDQANVDKLKAIKAVGGDTVVIFGNQMKPAAIDSSGRITREGKADSAFTDCKIDSAPCAPAVTAGLRIGKTFIFSNGSHFGGSALKCPADKNITSNGRLYTLLVIPTAGSSCTSSNGVYDLVAIYSGRATDADPALSVSRAATTLSMKVYAGMPAPVKRTDLPWLPDTSYLATFGKFTERFILFHASDNNVAGLAGFYHHTEMPLSTAGFDSILSVYRTQNTAIKNYLPSRGALVSPYIDARRTAAGRGTPATATIAARNIANTASGIRLNIAIQDGMGTSKGGAYMGSEAGSSVDKYAAAYMGSGSWASKYIAPTGDYYAAAKAGIAGTSAQLWANVEGMAPSGPSTANTCGDEKRGQTTTARLARQIQQLGQNTAKTISFMWDDYFTCVVNGKTLASQLAGNDPVIANASVRPASNGEIVLAGYNLSGSKVTIKYADSRGAMQSRTAKVASYDSRYGAARTGTDPRMESARFQVGNFVIKSGSFYTVSVTNAAGKTNPALYSKQYVAIAASVSAKAAAGYTTGGAIGSLYNSQGRTLGEPTSNEYTGHANRVQNFQRGLIYWSPATGAHSVRGGILGEYRRLGTDAGKLGLPVTEEKSSVRGGVYQQFKGGIIYWSPATGAHAVLGAIRTLYAQNGAERGQLGFPTSGEISARNAGANVYQSFEHGMISWNGVVARRS